MQQKDELDTWRAAAIVLVLFAIPFAAVVIAVTAVVAVALAAGAMMAYAGGPPGTVLWQRADARL